MSLSLWKACLRCDLRRMIRDQFLLGAMLCVLAISLGLRFAVPWFSAELLERGRFDFQPYLPLLSSYFALANAQLLSGMVMGFLLIESREEKVVAAQRVTPVSLQRLSTSSLFLCMLMSLILCVLLALGLGVGRPTALIMLLSALMGAPMAVVFSLLMASLAENKVQAFAVAKILSLLASVPVFAYFLPKPFHWIAGVVPLFWPSKIWWAASQGQPWDLFILPGVLVSALWIAVLLVIYKRALV